MIPLRRFKFLRHLLVAAALLAPAGCFEVADMRKQPRHATFDASTFFADDDSSRPLVDDTVSTAGVQSGPKFFDEVAPRPPLTLELLEAGRERFNVYCSPCHAQDGYGNGMIVQRSYPRPPSYHEPRLRAAPDEYIYRVITYGLGKMPRYGDDVMPADRWSLVAYVRALQLSQAETLSDLSPAERDQLRSTSQPARETP